MPDVHVMELDLASLDTVRSFAKSFKEKYNKLDLLINNARVMIPPYSKTKMDNELNLEQIISDICINRLINQSVTKTK